MGFFLPWSRGWCVKDKSFILRINRPRFTHAGASLDSYQKRSHGTLEISFARISTAEEKKPRCSSRMNLDFEGETVSFLQRITPFIYTSKDSKLRFDDISHSFCSNMHLKIRTAACFSQGYLIVLHSFPGLFCSYFTAFRRKAGKREDHMTILLGSTYNPSN